MDFQNRVKGEIFSSYSDVLADHPHHSCRKIMRSQGAFSFFFSFGARPDVLFTNLPHFDGEFWVDESVVKRFRTWYI
jgi:hypothetical protein